jgi:hypothetical protein
MVFSHTFCWPLSMRPEPARWFNSDNEPNVQILRHFGDDAMTLVNSSDNIKLSIVIDTIGFSYHAHHPPDAVF